MALTSERIIIAHSGAMTQALVERYAVTLRAEIGDCAAYAVFIEMAQNIMKYSAERLDDYGCGRLSVSLMRERCIISAVNPVTELMRRELDERLTQIIPMNRDELRRLFSERIRTGSGGSGGVGLIQIAQAVCEPLCYSFEESGGIIGFALSAAVLYQ